MIRLRAALAAAFLLATQAVRASGGAVTDAAPAPARRIVTVTPTLAFGGAVTDAVVVGERAYVAMGARVVAVDVADPDAPRIVARSDELPDWVRQVEHVPGAGVLVATYRDRYHGGQGGVAVLGLDAGGSGRPPCPPGDGAPCLLALHEITGHELSGAGPHARVAGRDDDAIVAWISGGSATVARLDGRPPFALRTLGAVWAHWLGDADTLRDVAIGEPPSIVHLLTDRGELYTTELRDAEGVAVRAAMAINQLDAHRLVARGPLLLVTLNQKGLRIYDTSRPERPVEVGLLKGGFGGADVAGDVAFVATRRGVEAVDISDPARPALLDHASIDLRGGAVAAGAARVVAWTDAALHVVRADDPRRPVAAGQLAVPAHGERLDADAGRVLVAGRGRGLTVVRTDGRGGAAVVGAFDDGADVLDVRARGDVALVAAGRKGLRVLDVSDPAAIAERASLTFGDDADHWASRIERVGDLAYVGGDGVYVVDVADPDRPVEVARFEGGAAGPDGGRSHWIDALSASGDLLAVITRGSELVLFDVSDPAAPLALSRTGPIAGAREVLLAGGLALVGHTVDDPETGRDRGAVAIYDVSDGGRPRLAGTLASAGTPTRLARWGAYVVAAVRRSDGPAPSLEVHDVRRMVGGHGPVATLEGTRGLAEAIAVDGDVVYVWDGAHGLLGARLAEVAVRAGAYLPMATRP